MPRGRRSLQTGASTPASIRSASPGSSVQGSGRLTRATSSKNVASLAQSNAGASVEAKLTPISLPKRPRGRPSKASLVAATSRTPSEAVAEALDTPAVAGPAQAASVLVPSSESVSPAPSAGDGFSDNGYSTPATSKVPTPLASDVGKSTRRQSGFVIEIPPSRRSARDNIYALNSGSARRRRVAEESDEEDDLVQDPSLRAAQQLQAEEYAKLDNAANQLTSRRRSGRVRDSSQSTPARLSNSLPKRERSSTITHGSGSRPSKKPRVIPDSDELAGSDIDMDAEFAAGAAFDDGQIESLTDEAAENSFADSEMLDDAEQSDSSELSEAAEVEPPGSSFDEEELGDEAQSSEDEPLSHRAPSRSRKAARAAVSSRPQPRATRGARTRGVGRPSAGRPSRSAPENSDTLSLSGDLLATESEEISDLAPPESDDSADTHELHRIGRERRAFRPSANSRRMQKERDRLESSHPEIKTMWTDLEAMPVLKAGKIPQPTTISRQLKPFQLEGVAWMREMEKTPWKGGLLGDEMGLGKTIQAVSLIMSDYPASQPSLVLVPPVALMQWQSEIKSYTDGTLKTFVFHGTNQKAKGITVKELKKYDVIMMSYNSLESMYRKQEKGFKRKDGIYKEESVIHSINFHRVILDEAHCIKTRTTMTAKACFALKTDYRWCLTGTPLQNRIGEFFSLIRFLNITPFASYLCKQCPCSTLEWTMNDDSRCSHCNHAGMQHVSVFNQELLNPIQRFGNMGRGREAFRKLRLMTDRIMLRRLKKDHTNSMELPVKEIYVDRQFFGEEENDFANSIMTSGQRKFDTYVAQGVLLNNYANIFGLIMQMRQVADHPDLILKKNAEGGQNILVCCICDEPAEDTVRSRCKHDFCRSCVASYVRSTDEPDCPRCHIPLSIDLEQPEIEQDEALVKKNSIINRIKMENWTSSSKIELLVHELHKLRSDKATHKSIIFSQFTTMLQLVEWRLRRAGITTVMLDGSMTPAQRQASIEHFMTNVDVECFLVSLKAGGVALNLTEASRVFIVDPWWNPAAEWQSADRCHRIGQTRPCTITRLCIEDSVESRMVLIQEKKTNMINSTVNADDKAMESLSPEDMQFLFRGS